MIKRWMVLVAIMFVVVRTNYSVDTVYSAKKRTGKAGKNNKKRKVDCLPPCRVCAPWEDSCKLPEHRTPSDAKKAGIYHFVNPDTGENVYRNRSYEANPFPYVPRTVEQAADWRVEYRITELMYHVLQKSKENEKDLFRRSKDQFSTTGKGSEHTTVDDIAHLQSVAWEEQLPAMRSELLDANTTQLKFFCINNGKETLSTTCKNAESDVATALFTSKSRSIAMAALASERFWLQSLNNFDIIFDAFIELLASLQQQMVVGGSSDQRRDSETHKTAQQSGKCAILIDDRSRRSLSVSIKHMLFMLDSEWSLVLYHTRSNEVFMRRIVNDYRIQNPENSKKIPTYYRRMTDMSWDKTSAIRTSSVFYNTLPSHCQQLLIFEDDAVMRKASRHLDSMLQFPLVGAPFRWCSEQWCRYGGNGGASIRSKEAMLEILTEIRCTSEWSCELYDLFRDSQSVSGKTFNTEDVFIAKQMYSHKEIYEQLLPTFNEMQQFSVETMYYPDPVFVHKVWGYLHPINAIELLSAALSHYPIHQIA